jgi:hypothetical protein
MYITDRPPETAHNTPGDWRQDLTLTNHLRCEDEPRDQGSLYQFSSQMVGSP